MSNQILICILIIIVVTIPVAIIVRPKIMLGDITYVKLEKYSIELHVGRKSKFD